MIERLFRALGYVPVGDLLRAQDLVAKFQRGGKSTLRKEGYL